MKKLFGLLFCLGAILFVGSPASALNVNNFTITNYAVDLNLSRDAKQHSVLNVTETITALFPSYDHNHGIERNFAVDYDGHPTQLSIISITDEKGSALPYHWSDTNTIRIGSADAYVHGLNTYVIKYTQRDVTKYFSDTNKDEFYWDVIGTDFRVPINKAVVTLNLAEDLANSERTATGCYTGTYGSTEKCEVVETAGSIRIEASNLSASEGITLVIGFAPGTFAQYEAPWYEKYLPILFAWQFISVFIMVIIVVIANYISRRKMGRDKELGIIVPEYLPPKNNSVLASATVISRGSYQSTTAQILDLAVRHYIKIYETGEKKWYKSASYEIEVIKSLDNLKWEEHEMLSDMFDGLPETGKKLKLDSLRNDYSYLRRLRNNGKDLDKLLRGKYDLRELDKKFTSKMRLASLILLLVGLFSLSTPIIFSSFAVFINSFGLWRLTDKGLTLKRYLNGLKMYISVAEVDRIKMLQSPEGAEKVEVKIEGEGDNKLVKLYEKVLPYAVLFGQEKEWIKQLGDYYESSGSQPDWFVGQYATFSAASFVSSMSNLGATAGSTAYSSSSTGGSGGGGSSGGGGGGGGGGGW